MRVGIAQTESRRAVRRGRVSEQSLRYRDQCEENQQANGVESASERDQTHSEKCGSNLMSFEKLKIIVSKALTPSNVTRMATWLFLSHTQVRPSVDQS